MSSNELKHNREVKSNLLPLYLKNHRVGKVHSKFNNGLNVQFDDALIYVGGGGSPLSAFGLNIEEEKLNAILTSVRIDDMVVNKDDKLIFYSVDGTINIYYKEIEKVDLTLPKIKCNINEIPNTGLYNYLKNIEFEKCIGINLDEETSKHVDLLLNSDKADWNINVMIIRFFVGRGKGLTPSGDDILIGFTLALMMFGKFNSWRNALEAEVTRDRTTMISVAYLSALLVGYASESFIRLVKLIDDVEMEKIEKTIKEVQSFGHTSGNDTLFGLLLGLKFLRNQKVYTFSIPSKND
ncbi:DUF2877 domain-containing protein [Pelosinus sp. IPA-1]|uniref:DUF2877 domain-containing protein n=1 Tax=Pelosinus sp. IPA-1 TaxID=3029569 RepID=UPI002436189F|nr:DUF2877 domain-containing protein [Pelosinus sp. IPA-1]GMA98897.1 hypothetical protein PIPA1_16970 [Pelosinus sp. IPA-1]